ncbi:MAG: FlhC family transcriptional regulator [Rhodocyclaceae bacterium]|nr:FlhC family transcriptional regulator [Rhodocyclaceae bacterium]
MLSPDQLEIHRVANELIRLKLRVPIVHYLTGIHSKPLRLRWRQLHKESPPNGKLPDSVRSFITDAMLVAKLSSFVALYNRLDDCDGKSVTASMLLRAWEMHGRVGSGDLDINAAWYAIRDVRAKIVMWQRCPQCQAGFIYEPNESHARSCPFCALSRQR